MYSPGVLNWGCLCRVTKCHDRGLSSCLEISGRGIWGLIALGHPRALSYIIMNRDVRRIRKHQAKSPVHISEQKHGRLSNHSTGIHPRSTVPAAWYQEPVEALRASEDLPGESRGPVRSLPLDQPAVATWPLAQAVPVPCHHNHHKTWAFLKTLWFDGHEVVVHRPS